jgi:hypothetical protein
VRVKTQQAKVEVDLEVDVRSDNYDQNASEALKIKKQVKAKDALDPLFQALNMILITFVKLLCISFKTASGLPQLLRNYYHRWMYWCGSVSSVAIEDCVIDSLRQF